MAKNPNKIKEGSVIADVIFYILAVFFGFIALYPMWYVLVLSISEPQAALAGDCYWWPRGLYFGGYETAVMDSNLWKSYRNTIIYCIITCVLMLFTTSTCAYPLTSHALKGRKYLTFFLLIPMYFNGGMIPSFLLIVKLGLYDTPWALILPGAMSIWYTILMRSFFRTIGESLREAAMIDGADHYRVFFNLYLPNSKAIIAVIALYTIIGVWNSWFQAMLYLRKDEWRPLQLYLRRLLIFDDASIENMMNLSDEELARYNEKQMGTLQMRYTIIMLSSIPMMLAYPFFQKYFVKGVMLGSLKE